MPASSSLSIRVRSRCRCRSTARRGTAGSFPPAAPATAPPAAPIGRSEWKERGSRRNTTTRPCRTRSSSTAAMRSTAATRAIVSAVPPRTAASGCTPRTPPRCSQWRSSGGRAARRSSYREATAPGRRARRPAQDRPSRFLRNPRPSCGNSSIILPRLRGLRSQAWRAAQAAADGCRRTRMTLKSIGIIIAALGLAAASPAQAEDLLVTQYKNDPSGAPYGIALEKGFFKAHGLDIPGIISGAGGGSSVRNAIASDLGYGDVTAAPVIAAAEQGQDVKIVGITSRSLADLVLVVMPDSPLKSPADLKG